MPARADSGISLPASVAWGTLGAALYAAAQWLLLILLARMGSPEDLGRFSLALAIAAPAALLFSLNLRTLVATDAAHAHPLTDLFRLRAGASALYLALIALLALLLPVAALLVALALWKTAEAFSEVCYGAQQRADRMDRIGASQCLKALAMVAAFGLAFTSTRDLVLASTMLIGASGLVLVAFDLPRVQEKPQPAARGAWLPLVVAALPAGGAVFLDSLLPSVPRYLLQAHHGEAELGYFSAAACFMVAGGTLVGAIGFSVTPRLARLYPAQRAEFRRLFFGSLQSALVVGVAGLAVASVLGGPILGLVYGPRYAAYESTLVVVMLAALLWYGAGIAGCALNAARRFGANLAIMAAALAALGAAAMVLIPSSGALGAAWALCIGMAVRCALSTAAALRL